MNDAADKKMTKMIAILATVLIALLGAMIYLTIQYKNSDNNAVIIYYKGYSAPRIRYRYDKEPWGPLEGELMSPNTDSIYKEYTHKFVLPLKKYKYILASFNDGAGKLDDNNCEYYKFEKGAYLFDNGEIICLNNTFQVAKLVASKDSAFVNEKISLNVSTVKGTGPFMYKFIAQLEGGQEMVIQEFVNNNVVQWTPTEPGNYTIKVIAQDSKGETAEKKIKNFNVTSFAINDVVASLESPQKLGTSIGLNMDIENSADLDLTCYYEISNGQNSIKLEATSIGAADWSPTEIGTYTIKAVAEIGEYKVEKSIEYEIEEEEIQLVRMSVYYSGIENPVVYYKTVNVEGDFVSSQMVFDESKPGYRYRADLDIPYGAQVMVYFSDGFAYTDDNYGQYYLLEPGCFGILNGQITDLEHNPDSNQGSENGQENMPNNNWWEMN